MRTTGKWGGLENPMAVPSSHSKIAKFKLTGLTSEKMLIHFSTKIETEDRLSQATKKRQQEIEKKVCLMFLVVDLTNFLNCIMYVPMLSITIVAVPVVLCNVTTSSSLLN